MRDDALRHLVEEFSKEAIHHYGFRNQAKKTMEELIELHNEIYAYMKRHGDPLEVIDEIADVLIMAEQMRQGFGPVAVDKRIAYKIERQRKRMREGE